MLRSVAACTTILTLGLSSAVLAQGVPGFYAGGQIGYSIGDAESNIPNYEPDSPYSNNVDGVTGGIFAGYNIATSGPAVFGIEAGVNILDTSGSFVTGGTEEFYTNGKWEASLVGRVGTDVSGYFLYGLAGASVMKVEGHYNDIPSQKDNRFGVTLGLGAEKALSTNLFGRVEYRYANYGEFDLQCDIFCGPTYNNINPHNFKVGVGMSF